MIHTSSLLKLVLPASILFFACDSTVKEDAKQSIESESISQSQEDSLTYRLIYQDSIGWGYQIFEGSKMLIDQKHIPAVQGLKGFASKQKAEIAANYILKKIHNGIFPPTLSQIELDSLNVLN